MPEKKAKATGRGGNILARGADGSLYVVSEDKPPRKLKAAEAQTVKQILEDAGRQVGERLAGGGGQSTRGSSVNVEVSLAELPS